VLTCPLFCVFPNMTSDRFGIRFGMSTFREKRAVFANLGVGFVFPVSRTIGGFVGKFMFGRAQIHVFFRYVLKLLFEEQTFLGSKTAVSNHCKNFSFLQSWSNRNSEITCIQSDFLYLESEPVDLSIQPFKIW